MNWTTKDKIHLADLNFEEAKAYMRIRKKKSQSENMALIFATSTAPSMDRTDERMRTNTQNCGALTRDIHEKFIPQSRGDIRRRANELGVSKNPYSSATEITNNVPPDDPHEFDDIIEEALGK